MTKIPIPESYWVEENRFLAGEYPATYGIESTRQRMTYSLKRSYLIF
jgi:hypothetical protein